ncbi:MAG: DUF488 family protein [Allosphingosinicella sp.]|uniref:DUF488 domain-containing protein n=1 Tax=Allosphingosinicella sp. TaxID=2823234 RepID=UPI00394B8ACC
MTKRVFTIGYESATQAELIEALRSAGVARVIDVRAVPNSRRPGFSKNALRGGLADAGIDYVHLRALGTPADGRAAARRGDSAALDRIYAEQLETMEAVVEAERMRELAAEAPSALLCYERDPEQCHRSLLRAAALSDWERIDLFC